MFCNFDIFKAGVDFHGVHDWAIFLPMWAAEIDAKNADVAPDTKEARAWWGGGELAFKSSPVASIANWRSPVLFGHGDDDHNVPFQQTTELVEKLQAQKVAIEELIRGFKGPGREAEMPPECPLNPSPSC